MAYVGTPRLSGNLRYDLASVLQGEAGGSMRGMQAVGNVISNRAGINFGGYGSSIAAQIGAPMQFQGQASPSESAFTVADMVISGNNPSVVGNSLNYAARAGTTAQWALNAFAKGQGINVGGNIFWANSQGDAPSGAGVTIQDVTKTPSGSYLT